MPTPWLLQSSQMLTHCSAVKAGEYLECVGRVFNDTVTCVASGSDWYTGSLKGGKLGTYIMGARDSRFTSEVSWRVFPTIS